MARLEFQFRQLEQFPKKQTPPEQRRKMAFKTQLPRTIQLLAYELSRIGAINPVFISTAHGMNQVRIDGLPRADVTPPKFQGVVIEFACSAGRLQFACDGHTRWEQNLHAIVLTLESLRAVERYGAVAGQEQYGGFKSLPAPHQLTGNTFPSVDVAAKWVRKHDTEKIDDAKLLTMPAYWQRVYRDLAKKLHPDTNGGVTSTDWTNLQAAADLINKHHGL